MGVFGRRAPDPGDLAAYVPIPPKLRVLRADGQRIDLTKRDTGAMVMATRQNWAAQAWAYRDLIGELRYAQRLRSRAVARVRFYIAATRPWPADPVPLDGDEDHGLDPQLAADAITNFARIPFDHNPDGFTARLDENLGVVGEAWIHIDANDQFHVRSTSEVTASQDGRVTINTLPTATAASSRPVDPATEDLLRVWVPHPEWGQLADSPMRTLLDVAEDVVLAGREQRAAARSRVAANGLLLMPDTLSLVRSRDEDDEQDDSVTSDTFMADFTAAMLAPIRDDGDAQAVVPIVIRGDSDDLQKVKHLTLQRADAEQLIARQTAALLRLLKGLDVQPEQVEGMASLNHWGSWSVDARSIKEQVLPAAETIAACMMQAFMAPALESLGHADLSSLVIAVDTSPLAENPNRGQDARDAYDRTAISAKALRESLGFGEEDAPDDDEKLRRLAASGALPVGVTAALLGLSQQDVKQAAVIEGQITDSPGSGVPGGPPRALPQGDKRPVAAPGQVTPSRPTPPVPANIVAAAALAADWVVDVGAGRRLTDIDAALVERITVAADAAVARVAEKAGARVRSAAQKDRSVVASLAGVEVHKIPALLGRERVESFVPVDDLIVDSYERLRTQVSGWLGDAATQTVVAVADLLHLETGSARHRQVWEAVTGRLAGHADRAWPILLAALDEAAEDALFPDPDAAVEGEDAGGLVAAQDVVDALAAAGGDALALTAAAFAKEQRRRRKRRPIKRKPRATAGSGYAAGPVVRQVIAEQGGVQLGWQWDYRPEVLRSTFPPHRRLDEVRFPAFGDPKLDVEVPDSWIGPSYRPQDHVGCRCTASPIFAVLDDPEDIVARRLREAAGDPRNVVSDRLAVGDDAAGREGTSAQMQRDVRSRILADVEELRREHIEKPKPKRRRR